MDSYRALRTDDDRRADGLSKIIFSEPWNVEKIESRNFDLTKPTLLLCIKLGVVSKERLAVCWTPDMLLNEVPSSHGSIHNRITDTKTTNL